MKKKLLKKKWSKLSVKQLHEVKGGNKGTVGAAQPVFHDLRDHTVG